MAEPAKPPAYPHPEPYTANVLLRLWRGSRSWFGLLNEWDFRVPLGRTDVMGRALFLVSDPPLVRQVLVDQVDRFPKHPFTLWLLEPLIGRGIFSVNGAEWARQRRLLDQAFQVAQLRQVLPEMQGAVQVLLQRLERAGESAVDFEAEMTLVTADVIMRTILSRPLEAAEAAEILHAFQRYQHRAGRALVLRLRHQLHQSRWTGSQYEALPDLLVEECLTVKVSADGLEPLDGAAALELLEAPASGNVDPGQRQQWLQEAVAEIDALQPALAALAERRADLAEEDHRRVREASLRTGESLRMRFRCEPSLPVDVIGLIVLLPAPTL